MSAQAIAGIRRRPYPVVVMVTADQSYDLRRRAVALRAFADRVRRLKMLEAYRWAGADVWVGPSPQRCDDALRRVPITLNAHADTLWMQARRLDRIADEVEARARLPGLQ